MNGLPCLSYCVWFIAGTMGKSTYPSEVLNWQLRETLATCRGIFSTVRTFSYLLTKGPFGANMQQLYLSTFVHVCIKPFFSLKPKLFQLYLSTEVLCNNMKCLLKHYCQRAKCFSHIRSFPSDSEPLICFLGVMAWMFGMTFQTSRQFIRKLVSTLN